MTDDRWHAGAGKRVAFKEELEDEPAETQLDGQHKGAKRPREEEEEAEEQGQEEEEAGDGEEARQRSATRSEEPEREQQQQREKSAGAGSNDESGSARETSQEPVAYYKTEAERRYEEARRQRLRERLRREGVKTHKERVEEYNRYLSKLSEHHDMPKIGPG